MIWLAASIAGLVAMVLTLLRVVWLERRFARSCEEIADQAHRRAEALFLRATRAEAAAAGAIQIANHNAAVGFQWRDVAEAYRVALEQYQAERHDEGEEWKRADG